MASRHRPRLDFCLEFLRQKGFEVVLGDCMDGSRYVSAPAAERATELTAMLIDPTIRAVIPPWGGELAIDLLPHLDWSRIGAADPTWLVGFSDISTLITSLTLRTGIATIHGNNLMDTPYEVMKCPRRSCRGWTSLRALRGPRSSRVLRAGTGRPASTTGSRTRPSPSTTSTRQVPGPGSMAPVTYPSRVASSADALRRSPR
ncbi:MAG: LD-carboxypeptidase [Dermatophilaceae bacterium]